MAVGGVTAFDANAYSQSTVVGQQGRDPAQWGVPNDPAHAVTGPGQTPFPADTYAGMPGGEYAYHGPLGAAEGHGQVLDVTPIDPPGSAVSVAIGNTPDVQDALQRAHAVDEGGPLRAVTVNPPDLGAPWAARWDMQASDYGRTYAPNGTLVSTPGARQAHDFYQGNHKGILYRLIDYGERVLLNNIAAVTARSNPAQSAYMPSNAYPENVQQNPGPGVAWQSPPDPTIVAPTTTAEVNTGLEWM